MLILFNTLHAASDSTNLVSQNTSIESGGPISSQEDALLAEKLRALAEINVRFEPPINAIDQALEGVHLELNRQLDALTAERDRIEKFNSNLREERELAIAGALKPFLEERDKRRAPILAKVASLQASIATLQSNYTKGQRNPHYSRYYDAEAETDLGFKISIIQKEIEALYASVDGDINIQMGELVRTIGQDYDGRMIAFPSFYSREHELFREKNTKVSRYEEERARIYRERNQMQTAIYDEYDRKKAALGSS